MTTPAADSHEIISTRRFTATPAALFGAFADPTQLAQWWGPRGFTNTFDVFELKAGGTWRFTMHAPDGSQYPNTKQFVEVVPNERIVFRHVDAVHGFTMTMTFVATSDGTQVTWRMAFDRLEEAARVRSIVTEANEQNLDRLQAHLAAGR